MGNPNMAAEGRSMPRVIAASLAALFIVVACVALFTGHSSASNGQPLAPKTKAFSVFNIGGSTCTTITSLNVDEFAGSWYQVINNRYTTLFGGGSSCTGTVYTKSSDTSVDVQNGNVASCNTTEASTGTCDDFSSLINGSAVVSDSSQPGQLTLTLYTPFLFGQPLPTTGSYWICKLGPVVNGASQYAIVSDSDGVSLYVLARNVDTFYSTYYDEVYDYLSNDMSWLSGAALAPIGNTFGSC